MGGTRGGVHAQQHHTVIHWQLSCCVNLEKNKNLNEYTV